MNLHKLLEVVKMKKTVIDGEVFILDDEEDIDEETLIEISNNKGEEGDD